ncbi:fasciclin domain-containing protein [Flavobacterium amnicola]|uniref:Fasciclin domain-containing protein n=1 Tax=Flavobacterium amnicola TaxID=2506422 RepID=A0A4Q1K4N4_9FLAO|nr:fasciclin domain-containing protein [Flavobacterium amnicola]RXR20833.1 fasciclin domain-containing protein [Flavobacterium amnicola]
MKIKNQIIKMLSVVAFAFFANSCDDKDTVDVVKFPTIIESFKNDSNFSVLLKALEVTQLSTTLTNPGSYTIFAPNNTAFAAYSSTLIPAGFLVDANINSTSMSAAQIAELKKILQNHVLGVGTRSNDLLTAGYSKTFAAGVGSTTLSMFVNKVGTDVLVNGGISNGGAKVVFADIDASNGIVHKVDNVIKLPRIVNHVVANPDLASLLSVLSSTATGPYGDQSAVLTTLNGNGPFTVFAPLNTAFDTALAPGGFITGTNATPTNISKILRYHVSNGNLTSSSATSWTSSSATTDVTITTLAATAQQFKITKGTVKITELPVIAVAASNIKFVNIQAANGNIHTVDRVLQPVLP